ncbi:MAG: response regulator [Proteobacteria bacterium]|nr:response regulator [Pseudomonadota bacterium]
MAQLAPSKDTVLIASNLPEEIVYLKSVLESRFCVATVADEKEVVAVAGDSQPSLILIDIAFDGYPVFKRLKDDSKTIEIPIIFIKNRHDVDPWIDKIDAGAVDFVTRPICANELLARMDIHLLLKRQQFLIEKYVSQLTTMVEELTASNSKIEKSNKLKTELLSNVSHELRAPLNGIIGFSELIIGARSMKNVKTYTGLIISETEMLLDLINDLIDSEKIESGQDELAHLPFDLERIVNGVTPFMNIDARKKSLAFKINIENGTIVRLNGDPQKFRQVMVNLIVNAIKFTEKGSVLVNIKQVDESDNKVKIYVEVVDTGIGIALEKQMVIFERFVQADRDVTNKYGGTGLGLSITKALVELMNGRIGVESEIGCGSKFWFTVWLEKRYGSTSDIELRIEKEFGCFKPCDGDKGSHTGKILLVDDYYVNRDITAKHLKNAGYSVDIALNGKDAVEACVNKKFDLILMDVQMPEMDGYHATQVIRSGQTQNTSTRIVGISGNACPKDRDECLHAGMNAILTKPFRRKDLIETVTKWMMG